MEPRTPLHACRYTEEVFAVLGKKWTGVLVDLLLQRPARFNDLAAAVPQLSRRVLTERLQELQVAGLVDRTVSEESPVAVTYALTEQGAGLAPAMEALRIWAGAPVDEQGRAVWHTAADESASA